MRVVLFSEATPGGLVHSYSRAFRALGVEVVPYTYQPSPQIRGLQRVWAIGHAKLLNARLAKDLEGTRPDLVMVVKGDRLAPETIRAVKRAVGAPVVNFYPDDPFGDAQSNRPMHGLEVLAEYDVCFTFARHLFESYHRVGAMRVEYLPFARDPALHSPVPPVEPPEFELVFVGNLDAERVRWLEPLARRKLAIFGERTRAAIPAGSPLRGAQFFPAAYEHELAQALARGAISVNVMRFQNRLSHNMRSFESPACGAFTLSQRTPELIELFREGEEIACFGSTDELEAATDRWLSRPLERRIVPSGGSSGWSTTRIARARPRC